MKRKITSVLMAAILGASLLAGCGSTSSETSAEQTASTQAAASEDAQADSAQTEAAQTEAAQEAADSGSGEEVTLSFLSWYNEETMGDFIEAFEAENPNITIDLQYVPPVTEYVEKFLILSASEEMTDLFFTCAENKKEVVDRQLALDLSDMEIFDRIEERTAATYGADGEVYAFAPLAWTGAIFYNVDLFEEYGVEVPTTWDEFVEACRVFRDNGIEPYANSQGNERDLCQSLYQSMVISQNPNADQEINEGTATFEQYYTEPLQIWYDDMVASGLYSNLSMGLSGEQLQSMFASGQVAMISCGPWDLATYRELGVNFDTFPLADKEGNVILGGAVDPGFSVSSTSEHQEEALKFIEFMTREENLLTYHDLTGRAIVVDGIDYEMDPLYDKYIEQTVDGDFYLAQIEWENSAAIMEEFNTAIQDVLTGADTIDNVPKRLDAKNAELGLDALSE